MKTNSTNKRQRRFHKWLARSLKHPTRAEAAAILKSITPLDKVKFRRFVVETDGKTHTLDAEAYIRGPVR